MFEGLAVRRQLRGDEEIEAACHLATSHSRTGLDAANDCPVGATEVKVSPGGEKITARFEALPD